MGKIKENLKEYIKFSGIKESWIADVLDMKTTEIEDFLKDNNIKCDDKLTKNIVDVFGFTLEELKDEDFKNKFCTEIELEPEFDIKSFVGNNLKEDEIQVVEKIITLMDIINTFKEVNKNIIEEV